MKGDNYLSCTSQTQRAARVVSSSSWFFAVLDVSQNVISPNRPEVSFEWIVIKFGRWGRTART